MDVAQVASESSSRIAGLILAARDGSDEALCHLMKFSRQYLLLIADAELPGELQGKGGASDLVQETQFEAARAFATFRGATAAELLGWLRAILLHNLSDFTRRFTETAKRRVNREISLFDPEDGPRLTQNLIGEQSSPSGQAEHKELVRNVEQAVAALPDDYRQVVVWHNRDGLSFEEIGKRLDRSVGAVRKLWSRAIQQLQLRLETGSKHAESKDG